MIRFGPNGRLEVASSLDEAKKRGYEERVDLSSQLAVVHLDVLEGILSGIEEMNGRLKAREPVGQVRQYDFKVTGREMQTIHDPDNPWIDITVHNPREDSDGNSNSVVFVFTNRRNHPNPVRVGPGRIAHINFETPVIRQLYVSCNSAGASCEGWVVAKY